MKKITLSLCLLMAAGLSLKAQVGVNTVNPQGTFHVDGGKDNPPTGTPDASKQANDVVITNTGSVGIGTTNPQAKLDVQGAIQIQDGTQGAGKVLTSDGDGKASWKTVNSNTYISVTSIVDVNILGYLPSTTATASAAPSSVPVGSTTATKVSSGTFDANRHSYATYETPANITWVEAYKAAKSLGGYLATFTTDPEWQYVETTLLNPYSAFVYKSGWIGMCKFSWYAGPALTPDPEMKWITGEQPQHDYNVVPGNAVRKSNWFNLGNPSLEYEPNNGGNIEGFVHFWHENMGRTKTINGYTTTHPWNDISNGANSGAVPTKTFIVEFQQ